MRKNVVKFGAGVLGLVAVGAALFYGMQWYEERTNPEYALKQKYEKLMEQYRSDTYGGTTPEETLRLFIDALKTGDTDLAAKYFVVDKQAEWREKLLRLQEKNLLNSMIADLSSAQRGNDISEDSTRFIIPNKNSEVVTILHIGRGPNGKWKIINL